MGTEYKLYWGDMHTQFNGHRFETGQSSAAQSFGGIGAGVDLDKWRAFLEEAFESAREHLDFFPIVYYPAYFYQTAPGLKVETVGMKPEFLAEFEIVRELVKKHNRPRRGGQAGELVTFLGYEWTGDRTRWGDHNVFYRDDDQPLDLSDTIDELYANLRQRNGIAIPHHTAYRPHRGGQAGERGKDWGHYDERISPFSEIFSIHGCSEGAGAPLPMARNVSMGPRVSGGAIQDGLARGCRTGIIASGDNANGFPGRHGTGLMACCATELTRDALWDAFLARRVYGVTGDRIQLDFRVNDAFMGQVINAGSANVCVRVKCTQALDRIELLKNNRVIHTHCHNGTWAAPASGTFRAKVKIEHGHGPAQHYGMNTDGKEWRGKLAVSNGKIRSVEGCFTRLGQHIEPFSDAECEYRLTTGPRTTQVSVNTYQQSIVFEIEGARDTQLRIECDEINEAFTLGEALDAARCFDMRRQVAQRILDDFGLAEEQIENARDVYYHNAYKIKVHQAVPETAYIAEMDFVDDAMDGDYYYVRISQVNGQYAWSSPIWIQGK